MIYKIRVKKQRKNTSIYGKICYKKRGGRSKVIGEFIACIVVALIMIIMGYQIHIKKKLWLIAGYQEETFVGDKERLAKIFGFFSYVIGIATFLLPFGLESIGDIAAIIFTILVILGTVLVIVWANLINKHS